MFKLILALMATLTSLQAPAPSGNVSKSGGQSVKGGTFCVWTQRADGRRVYSCEKR